MDGADANLVQSSEEVLGHRDRVCKELVSTNEHVGECDLAV